MNDWVSGRWVNWWIDRCVFGLLDRWMSEDGWIDVCQVGRLEDWKTEGWEDKWLGIWVDWQVAGWGVDG